MCKAADAAQAPEQRKWLHTYIYNEVPIERDKDPAHLHQKFNSGVG